MKENNQNPQTNNLPSVQAFLPIEEIKDGTIVLKDKSLRAVLAIRSSDFALRAEEEQQAIITSWQSFLNSLEFPIQIVVRSRKVDLTDYLKSLENIANHQKNSLLKYQTQEYIEFLKGVISVSNIMTKEFYVVVPYFPTPITTTGFLEKIGQIFGFKLPQNAENFESSKASLYQRVEIIKNGLENVGLRVAILNTEQLIDLFYNVYNPDLSYHQKLTDVKEIGITGV